MKNCLLYIFICLTISAQAQKNIKALIHAERSFASYTVSNGIKKGFLQFLDSTGIIFPAGDAVNGMALHSKGPGSPAQLNWAPEYAVISTSGDFGFTTGPYHLQRSATDTISGRGQYSSIWHINKQGEWKVLADMGVRYTHQRPLPEVVAELDLKKITTQSFTLEDVKTIDQQLNEQLKEKGNTAYGPYLSAQSWFNANNHAPVMGARDIGDLLKIIPHTSNLQYINAGMASSNDLAFTYGKSDKNPYLRVWTKQVAGWVLLLQVH
jgi:hypothetical protein